MRIIDKFVDYVENYNYTDGGFLIEGDEGKARFTAMEIGSAVFIYGQRIYGDDVPEIGDTLHLAAIIGLCGIYITDTSVLNPYVFKDGKADIKYPLHSMNIKDYNINEWVRKNVFPEFYNKLPIISFDDYVQKETLWSVRVELLGLGECTSTYKLDEYMEDIFDVGEYPSILAGIKDVKHESYTRLEKLRDYYSFKKSKKAAYNEMLNNGKNYCQDWEKHMAKALLNVIDSNYITVEFKHDSYTSSTKINARKLISSLIEQTAITSTAFNTYKNEERVYKELGVRLVHCSDINKIMYRGKTIYQKEN
ncbi:MAG: hypothetical protein IJT36_03235 [Alphaproteobacteria bacterium]|nr:hypothetical protein [Alphaproteobacteria bacterium]